MSKYNITEKKEKNPLNNMTPREYRISHIS